jgi:hypothetical protein
MQEKFELIFKFRILLHLLFWRRRSAIERTLEILEVGRLREKVLGARVRSWILKLAERERRGRGKDEG